MSWQPRNYPLNIIGNPGSRWDMVNSEDIILCSSNCTVYLPAATTALPKLITIKNYSTGPVIVAPIGSDMIDFNSQGVTVNLAKRYSSITLYPAFGPYWWIESVFLYP